MQNLYGLNPERKKIPLDYGKIEAGGRTIRDVIVDLDNTSVKKANSTYSNKDQVLKFIEKCDYDKLREVSNFWYKTSGMYNRLCRYLAYMYRYDWLLTPVMDDFTEIDSKALKKDFFKKLRFLDGFEIKRFLGESALKVIRYGSYYGYIIKRGDNIAIQELPQKYCRSRFSVNGVDPCVEFQMKYFDDYFNDSTREQIFEVFPKEFKKGYELFHSGKLPPQFNGDTAGWYMLDPKLSFKFSINNDDFPILISVVPALIDLDFAQALDRKKMQQQLLKIFVQKMPLDKNFELVFDMDETAELHSNAVKMLGGALGVNVLTTFADTDMMDVSDSESQTAKDDLERVEREVYNTAGISQMQFNTDGNLSLEKSILNDEASLYNLIQQFESFLNKVVKIYNKNGKFDYMIQILPTTIYNYKDLSKMYKEQTSIGYSKMLPQIAMGQSQSAILSNAYFENDVLDLINVFLPPISSNNMNADILQREKDISGDSDKQGRPTNQELGKEVSEKTIMNKESMS